jgi:cellulase/cellobiase CelA1
MVTGGVALAGPALSATAPGPAAAIAADDASPPTVPTGLRAAVTCTLVVTLTWTASTDNVAVTGYDVFRSTNNGPFVSVATTAATSFTDRLTGLFQYQVRARDAAGNTSAFTAPVSALPPPCPITPPPDTVPPTTPGTPTATVSCGSATLTWAASNDNVRVAAYEIWQAPGTMGGTFVQTGTTTTTSFTQQGVGASRYQIRARDAAGNTSPFTPPITVITPACPVTTPPPTVGCTAIFSVVNSWQGAFQGQVTVTNTGATATTGWTVTLTFPDGQVITQLWGGRTSNTASPYTITNESYNGGLGPNASTSFGFIASWSGTNGAPTVTCTRTP